MPRNFSSCSRGDKLLDSTGLTKAASARLKRDVRLWRELIDWDLDWRVAHRQCVGWTGHNVM